MTDETLARLAQVFEVVLGAPPGGDPRQASQETMPAWDSLGHVTLVSAIGSEFEVEISVMDSLDITSFDAAAGLLDKLLSQPMP